MAYRAGELEVVPVEEILSPVPLLPASPHLPSVANTFSLPVKARARNLTLSIADLGLARTAQTCFQAMCMPLPNPATL